MSSMTRFLPVENLLYHRMLGQLSTTKSNGTDAAQLGAPSCSRPQPARIMGSEMVDPIDWPLPPTQHSSVPSQLLVLDGGNAGHKSQDMLQPLGHEHATLSMPGQRGLSGYMDYSTKLCYTCKGEHELHTFFFIWPCGWILPYSKCWETFFPITPKCIYWLKHYPLDFLNIAPSPSKLLSIAERRKITQAVCFCSLPSHN